MLLARGFATPVADRRQSRCSLPWVFAEVASTYVIAATAILRADDLRLAWSWWGTLLLSQLGLVGIRTSLSVPAVRDGY